MTRSIAGLVLAGALLLPGHLGAAATAGAQPSATAPARADAVASGSSGIGCTLECGPLMQLWGALVDSLAVGSSGGGGAPAAS